MSSQRPSLPSPGGLPSGIITGGGSPTRSGTRGNYAGSGPGGLPDGWSSTGERGTELVYKRGSHVDVFSHAQSKDIVAATGIDLVQLHGEEGPEVVDRVHAPCIKVLHVAPAAAAEASGGDVDRLRHDAERYAGRAVSLLLDSRVPGTRGGGTGATFDWTLASQLNGIPCLLAGGLTPDNVADAATTADQAIERFRIDEAIAAIWTIVDALNGYITENEPWALAKDPEQAGRLGTVLYTAAEGLRALAVLLSPVMPVATEKLWIALGAAESLGRLQDQPLREAGVWGALRPGTSVNGLSPLFPRVEQ
jgi:hypothetical protein